MTQIEQIKAEIERLKREISYHENAWSALDKVLDFINSLPAKQPSEDLEEEIKNYFNSEIGMNFLPSCDNINIARHFANWQKKQLMKNCLCDTEVMMHTKLRNTEYLILSNVILPPLPVSFGLNVGDKVKILIIKEDEQ